MFTWRSILPLLLMFLVNGCTMIPSYERPSAPIAASFAGVSATNDAAAAEIAWHNIFAEERLKRLISLALANNQDLQVAILNVEQSRAQYRIQRSTSLPTLEGENRFRRSYANEHYANEWSASISTTAYEIDFFGRVRSLNQQALEKFLATTEGRRSAQIALVAEVATQYFILRQAQAQRELAQRTVTTVQESYLLNKATFEAGAVSELDVRAAETQVETANINALNYERQIAQAENALRLIVGMSPPTDLPIPRPFEEENLVAEVPAGLPSELLRRRPDILEAEHTLKAANANIGAARAAFFPSVKLTASVGTSSSQIEQLFSSGTGLWSFSPQVTVPLFTGGQNRANLDVAKINTRIEVAHFQKAILTAFREVEDALVATRSYTQQLGAQERLIEAQRKRFELASARYRQGETTYLEVLSAQQELYSAERSRLETKLNALSSRITLYKSLGGGWK